jgi:2-keto-4-pentenoate hydratase/2-oxohepta-3-ene-1,7-dioic acid hydratase in catechol pathway
MISAENPYFPSRKIAKGAGVKIIRYQDQSAIKFAALQEDGTALELTGDLFGNLEPTVKKANVEKLLAPLQPTQIIGIGLNYRRHAEEASAKIPEYPVVFMKPLNTVQHPNEPIVLPKHASSLETDYECELAVVIGKTCKNVKKEKALEVVLGYTCANDVSERDWQLKRGGSQWLRGKAFDTFCPLGPALVTKEDIPNPNALSIKTVLNGVTVQDWTTNDMIFDVPTLIEFLSTDTTLLSGTVILTGTPHGVGMGQKPPRYLKAGDRLSVEIQAIGALQNSVAVG